MAIGSGQQQEPQGGGDGDDDIQLSTEARTAGKLQIALPLGQQSSCGRNSAGCQKRKTASASSCSVRRYRGAGRRLGREMAGPRCGGQARCNFASHLASSPQYRSARCWALASGLWLVQARGRRLLEEGNETTDLECGLDARRWSRPSLLRCRDRPTGASANSKLERTENFFGRPCR